MGCICFPTCSCRNRLNYSISWEKDSSKDNNIYISASYHFFYIGSFYRKRFLNIAFRVGFASATAYALGIIIDIFAFQQIRNNYKSWWIAPSISTVISNFIDTYTFFFTAFYKSKDKFMCENWIEIAFNQTLLKIFIGIIFFLPIYGFLLNLFLKISINKNKN